MGTTTQEERDAAYLVGHAAEVPVKSAQEYSGGASVVPVDLPKHCRGPAEGFLLGCVLEREIPGSCTQLCSERGREVFPSGFWFPGRQVMKAG